MRRISNSWAAFNVAAPASGWILAATAASWYRLLVPATSTPELEHSTTDAASRCGLLAFADAVGSSTWRASPCYRQKLTWSIWAKKRAAIKMGFEDNHD
jgi:hypothetical protein